MLRDIKGKDKYNDINLEEKDISAKAVIDFMKSNCAEFAGLYRKIKPETGLSQQFVIFMNQKASLFMFHSEYSEDVTRGDSPKADMGVIIRAKEYYTDKAFLLIEAKRLDSSIVRAREKEYVVGRIEDRRYLDTGGIERFKKNIHGKTAAKYAAMIGYMQSDSFAEWLNKINGWINEQIKTPISCELKWEKRDRLVKQDESGVYAEYKSVHSRITGTDIVLFHLWINLTSGSR